MTFDGLLANKTFSLNLRHYRTRFSRTSARSCDVDGEGGGLNFLNGWDGGLKVRDEGLYRLDVWEWDRGLYILDRLDWGDVWCLECVAGSWLLWEGNSSEILPMEWKGFLRDKAS